MSFVDYEERKLNAVVSNFSNDDKKRYMEEVDYIRSLLELLRKQKQEIKDAPTKEERDKAKKEEEKTKEDLDNKFNQLINSYSLKKIGTITDKVVPESVIEGAKLTKASHIYNTSGQQQAEIYLKQQGLDNWKIDPLSSKQILVLKDGDKIKLAARGTDAKGKNWNDMDYDVKAHFGTEQQHNILVDARKQIKAVKEAYPNAEIEGHGFSLGSNVIINLGKEFGFPTESYNGYITKNIVNNADKYTGIDHTIYRTSEDLPSIRSTYLDNVGDFKVKTIPVLENSMNPYKAHKLENFTTNNRSGKESSLQVKLRNVSEETSRHGELSLLNKMIHDTKGKEPRPIETEEEVEDTLIDRRPRTQTETQPSSTRFWDLTRDEPKRTKLTIRETGHHLDNMGIDNETLVRMKELDNVAKSYGKPHPPLSEPRVNSLMNNQTLPDSLSFVNQIRNREIQRQQRSTRNKSRQGLQVELDSLNDQLTGVDSLEELNRTNKELMKSSTTETQAKNQFKVNRLKSQWNRREFLKGQIRQRPQQTDIEMKPSVISQKPYAPLAEPIRQADMTSKPKGTTSIADELDLTGSDLIGGRGFARRLKNNRTIQPKEKELLIRKRSRVNLPDGNTKKSRTLSNQIDNLENQITSTTPEVDAQLQDVLDYAGKLSPPRSRPDTKQSFTEWANENGVGETNHKKSIWQLSGNELTDDEKVGFNKTLPFNDEDSLKEFADADVSEKAETLVDGFKASEHAANEVNDLIATPVRGDNISRLGNVARETFKGIHPMNLGVGLGSFMVADGFLNAVDKDHKQPEVLRTAETGLLAGGISASITGGMLMPEAIAGGVGMLAGKYSAEGIDYGLEKLGVNKDVSEGIGATAGGVIGGTSAVAAGSLAASIFGGAATGAEEGAVAGGGIFSAETMAIGGLVGGLVGLGSYAWSKLHG